MQYIKQMHDNQLNKPYKLYLVNARELSNRLRRSYGLDNLELQMFNSDTKLAQYTIDIAEYKLKGYDVDDDRYEVRQIADIEQKIANNTHVDSLTKIGIHFGYEMMPLAVSVIGDFQDTDLQVELIDGFKRMFCIDEVPDIDVLVKVYGEFTDREWINAMILYNSWKFSDGEGCAKYMDRGFQLGLSYRYNIRFVDMIMKWGNMFAAINLFTSGSDLNQYRSRSSTEGRAYYTFWDNSCFMDDLRSLQQILSYEPVFTIKKRGKPDEQFRPSNQVHSWGVYRVLEVFVSILGEIRRLEFSQGAFEQKPFDVKILSDYMGDPQNQKHMIKVCQMTVDGFIINYIRDHMRSDIREFIYEAMGIKS